LTYPPNAPKQVMVNWSDLERLEEEEMLNDNLIAFELRRLEIKHDQLADEVHFFNSYFYDSLTKGPNGRSAFKYDNVKSWTRKIDLFKYPYIIVPVNSAAHWYVFIICNADKLLQSTDVEPGHTDALANSSQPIGQDADLPNPDAPLIIALDSMGKPHSTEIGHLKSYLVEEAKHKRGQSITKADITSISAKGIPAQTNMFDCGVFLLGYMDTFLRDPRLFVEKVCSR
ncbi:hypothetical protein BDZ85DRAFT_183510, partial [Elsinoe ampelina]